MRADQTLPLKVVNRSNLIDPMRIRRGVISIIAMLAAVSTFGQTNLNFKNVTVTEGADPDAAYNIDRVIIFTPTP